MLKSLVSSVDRKITHNSSELLVALFILFETEVSDSVVDSAISRYPVQKTLNSVEFTCNNSQPKLHDCCINT